MERSQPPLEPRDLQRYLEVAPWPIHLADKQGRPCRPNPAFAALLGYRPDELGPAQLDECVPAETRDRIAQALREPKTAYAQRPLVYRHRRGLEVEARRSRLGPLDVTSGPTLVMLEGLEPVRPLDRSRIQSRMSRLIAHDLNNVFTVAQSYIDLAGRPETEPPLADQYIDRALNAVRRGIRVTRQIQTIVLDKPFPIEESDLSAVVEALEPFLSRLLPSAPDWTVECDSSLPPLRSHPALLGRFVLDMVTNALLRWPQSPQLRLEVRASPGRRPAALIRIQPPRTDTRAVDVPFRLLLCEPGPSSTEQPAPLFVANILADHRIPIDVTDRALTALLPADERTR